MELNWTSWWKRGFWALLEVTPAVILLGREDLQFLIPIFCLRFLSSKRQNMRDEDQEENNVRGMKEKEEIKFDSRKKKKTEQYFDSQE